MLLSPQDAQLFFKLNKALMLYVNQRLKPIADNPATPEEFARLSPQKRIEVDQAFLQHRELLDSFIHENPAHLSGEELDIVGSWRHLVAGDFYVFRYLKNYTVFLSSDEHPIAYGVLALMDPIELLIGPYLPVMVKAVLLPFKGQIIYDGLLSSSNVSFGPGIRRSLNESFKQAKQQLGIITSLPMSANPPPRPMKTPESQTRQKAKQKDKLAERTTEIMTLVDQFCRERLNEEYAKLALHLTQKLARKRPSPLLSGTPASWASGIVRSIGWVNFLGDPSQQPHMKTAEIDRAFGVSQATGAGKSKVIRDMFKLSPFDPNWTLPSRLGDNPMAWMITVNGIILDARHAPREIQEEAYRKGIIPYIPEADDQDPDQDR